jgi:hypothetical protein
MRQYQPAGLTQPAQDFLDENAQVSNQCKHCGRHDGFESEVIGQTQGMFGHDVDGLPLKKYFLKDGRTAEEQVQHCEWSSGPIEFWQLVVSDGTIFKWNEKALRKLV